MRKVTVLRMCERYAQTVLTFRITYLLSGFEVWFITPRILGDTGKRIRVTHTTRCVVSVLNEAPPHADMRGPGVQLHALLTLTLDAGEQLHLVCRHSAPEKGRLRKSNFFFSPQLLYYRDCTICLLSAITLKKTPFYGCQIHFLILRGGTLQALESAKDEIYTQGNEQTRTVVREWAPSLTDSTALYTDKILAMNSRTASTKRQTH